MKKLRSRPRNDGLLTDLDLGSSACRVGGRQMARNRPADLCRSLAS
jgi:hypothetical protein